MISPRSRANRHASVARLATKRQHASANLGKEFNAPPVRHARSSLSGCPAFFSAGGDGKHRLNPLRNSRLRTAPSQKYAEKERWRVSGTKSAGKILEPGGNVHAPVLISPPLSSLLECASRYSYPQRPMNPHFEELILQCHIHEK